MPREKYSKCGGSGGEQVIDWMPDPESDYPGAVVCIDCCYGVMIHRSGVTTGVTVSGREATFGVVRTHYVSRNREHMSYRMWNTASDEDEDEDE